MVEAKMGVKGLHPLQKHWVSPRLKMARSGQGRRRFKTFLPLDKAGKKPLLPSAKIQSRCWSHQIFGATELRFLIVSTIHSLSSAANMIPAWLQSELVRGLGSTASSSLPSLGPLRCLCFFFSSITGVILMCLVTAKAKFEGFIVPLYFFLFVFLFASVFSFWYRLV